MQDLYAEMIFLRPPWDIDITVAEQYDEPSDGLCMVLEGGGVLPLLRWQEQDELLTLCDLYSELAPSV